MGKEPIGRERKHGGMTMNKTLLILSGLGLGAGLIYMSVAEREEQHRRLAPAQWQTYRRRTSDLFGQTSRSLAHQTRGIARQTRGLLEKARPSRTYEWGPRQTWARQAGITGGTPSLWILGCVGIGAGLMYMLDPVAGRRRRTLVYDKAQSYWHATCDFLAKTGRDASNRTRGLVHEARTQLARTDRPADTVLMERVRAKIGRVVSQSKAINVTADHGCVTLRGAVPANEVPELLAAVESVPGVNVVVNQLEVKPESRQAAGAPNNSAE